MVLPQGLVELDAGDEGPDVQLPGLVGGDVLVGVDLDGVEDLDLTGPLEADQEFHASFRVRSRAGLPNGREIMVATLEGRGPDSPAS